MPAYPQVGRRPDLGPGTGRGRGADYGQADQVEGRWRPERAEACQRPGGSNGRAERTVNVDKEADHDLVLLGAHRAQHEA